MKTKCLWLAALLLVFATPLFGQNKYNGIFTGAAVSPWLVTNSFASTAELDLHGTSGGQLVQFQATPAGLVFGSFGSFQAFLDTSGNLTATKFTGNGSGLTNTIPFTLSAATNFALTFNGTLQQETFTNAVGVTFATVTGTSGSFSCYFSNNIPVAFPANVVWLTAHPTTVVKGVVSLTQYGLVTTGAYVESQ